MVNAARLKSRADTLDAALGSIESDPGQGGSGEDFLSRDHHLEQVLTPRECDVACGVYEGLSNKEIARSLDISPWTVSSHLRQVFAKLGITRRVELCRMWHQTSHDDGDCL